MLVEQTSRYMRYCGWTKSISHHFEPMVETIVSWYLQGNHIILEFLNGARSG